MRMTSAFEGTYTVLLAFVIGLPTVRTRASDVTER